MLKAASTFLEAYVWDPGTMPLRTFIQGVIGVMVVVMLVARVMYVVDDHVHHLTSMKRGAAELPKEMADR